MKKTFTLFIAVTFTLSLFAGGIVTNTNQSASYIRMMIRDASLGIDAVFYNPAGLTLLEDGFYFSVNNQTIFQEQIISNAYPFLNTNEYIGDISAPLFPGIYAAYKTGKFAFSLGFNPIGGGGSGTYNTGLPSFETGVSNLVPMLLANEIPTDKYSADIFFEGQSIFWGLQAGVSYQINDMISVYAGGRYVMASNSYKGYIRDIKINPSYADYNGEMVLASEFFNYLGTTATAGAASAVGASAAIQPLIDGGAGALTIPEAVAMQLIDATTQAQLEGGLIALGIDPSGMMIAQMQGAYDAAALSLGSAAEDSYANAAATSDVEVDAGQTGSGFCPIVGLNLNLMDGKLNIGMKYEFKTELELENETVIDGSGLFPDKIKTRNDVPAMFSAGLSYKATDKFKVSAGYHMYFDRDADYSKTVNGVLMANDQIIDNGSIEAGIGFEYDVSDKFLVSIGYLYTGTGVTEAYQRDLSFSLNSNSVGFGGQYKINDMLAINAGMLYTAYTESEKTMAYDDLGLTAIETYDKSNIILAVGFDFKFN